MLKRVQAVAAAAAAAGVAAAITSSKKPNETDQLEAPSPASQETPDAVVNPFKERGEQTLTSLKWLVTVLGAVATLVLAGTQLGGIGNLQWEEDSDRLVTAGVSALLSIVFVLAAVGVLAWAQLPGSMVDADTLERIAKSELGDRGGQKPKSGFERRSVKFLRIVARDPAYHQGAGSLAALLTGRAAFSEANERFEKQADAAEVKAIETRSADERTVHSKAAALARREGEKAADNALRYHHGLHAAAALRSYIELAHRARVATILVLSLSVLLAPCLVILAWAANAPTLEEQGSAVPQRPVAATLYLTSDEDVWIVLLGSECATAAKSTSGIDVIATASANDKTTILTIPSNSCEAREVTISADDGAVLGTNVSIDEDD